MPKFNNFQDKTCGRLTFCRLTISPACPVRNFVYILVAIFLTGLAKAAGTYSCQLAMAALASLSRLIRRDARSSGTRPRAFSLIEIILVMVIIAISSLGLVAVMQQVLRDRHKAEVVSTAAALAVNEAERLISLSFGNINDEHRDSPQAHNGALAAYSWEVRVDSIDSAQSNLVTYLGSDPTMQGCKVVEVRVHNSAIGYVSVIFLKTNH